MRSLHRAAVNPSHEMKQKRVAILGSTGSIGRQALEVIATQPHLSACALGAGQNWELLGEQARRFSPQHVGLSDPAAAEKLRSRLPEGMVLSSGPEAMSELVRTSAPDLLLTGVVGPAGLKPTLAGIECGATLAIANKETLVMAGEIVIRAARRAKVDVLPVDSEHSAIFQCLLAGRPDQVRKVILTASGGALRDRTDGQVEQATVEEALNHPTWNMGAKITIDSATLINKALEVVEAHWLFDLPAEQIGVALHPESIVHAAVQFADGSTIAQLSQPDMTLPISYALNYPDRPARLRAAPELGQLGQLNFHEPTGRFARAIDLGYEVIRRGGLAGAVLNSANEAAVEAFREGRIRFGRIVPLVEDVLSRTPSVGAITVENVLEAAQWARAETEARTAQAARTSVQRAGGAGKRTLQRQEKGHRGGDLE